jgi:hypothetical protein
MGFGVIYITDSHHKRDRDFVRMLLSTDENVMQKACVSSLNLAAGVCSRGALF